MRRIARIILILQTFLLLVIIAAVVLFVFIFRPVDEVDARSVASGMIEFYSQEPPHWNENLPVPLLTRDSKHFRFSPSTDVHPGYVAVGYYYKRLGIEYEQSFYLTRQHRWDTNDVIWTLMPMKQIWIPWMDEYFDLNQRWITITNGTCRNEDLLFSREREARSAITNIP
jgi:hypothetical protein